MLKSVDISSPTGSDRATSETPFLDRESQEYNYEKDSRTPSPKSKSWLRCNIKSVGFHSFLLLLNLAFLCLWIQVSSLKECRPQDRIYTPARGALEYQIKNIQAVVSKPTKYMGSTDSADDAWRDLMRHSSIRLDEADLQAINRTSIALPDGGYLGTPTVYHQLHCVKMLRWAVDLNRYSDEFSEQTLLNLPNHVQHCIDMLRQSIMCNGDASVVTYSWSETERLPQTDFQTSHQCINWEFFDSWVRHRSVDIFAPNVLIHPQFGTVYPEGYRPGGKHYVPP